MPNPHDSLDKRPKLERARSAAEKENQPMQRSSFGIRRQFSQQETSTAQRLSSSDTTDLVQRHMPSQSMQYQPSNSQQPQSSQSQDMYSYDDPKFYQVKNQTNQYKEKSEND